MENQIKFFRTINGMSQADLGKALNVTGATISSWEMDRTEPSMEYCLKMTKIFGCTLEELFGAPKQSDIVFTQDEMNILIEYRQADTQTKNMVKRLLLYAEKLNPN